MRVALVVHKFPPESLGGTEVYTLSLARALVRAGCQTVVFYPSTSVSTLTSTVLPEGIALWRAPRSAARATEDPARQYWHTFRDQAIEEAFTTFLQQVQPQVVHFQHVQGVSARLIALASGVPRLLTLHDYWYFCANSQLIRPDRTPCTGPSAGCWNCVDCATARADLQALRLLRPLVALPFAYRNHYLRQMTHLVDQFIAPSEFLRGQYINQGFPGEKIALIENGIDYARLQGAHLPMLPEPPTRPHFGFIGSLAWQKGVHVLVEAFNQLPANAALTIYGNEQVFPDYSAQLKTMARHPHIRFAGPIDFDHVGAALRQFDALVTPSLWYENSPVVIQEAYALGVPVIASRLGALMEKVVEGKTGWLFTAGDSSALATLLQELLQKPEQLPQIRAGITPPPTVEAHTAQMLDLYREQLASSRGQGGKSLAV